MRKIDLDQFDPTWHQWPQPPHDEPFSRELLAHAGEAAAPLAVTRGKVVASYLRPYFSHLIHSNFMSNVKPAEEASVERDVYTETLGSVVVHICEGYAGEADKRTVEPSKRVRAEADDDEESASTLLFSRSLVGKVLTSVVIAEQAERLRGAEAIYGVVAKELLANNDYKDENGLYVRGPVGRYVEFSGVIPPRLQRGEDGSLLEPSDRQLQAIRGVRQQVDSTLQASRDPRNGSNPSLQTAVEGTLRKVVSGQLNVEHELMVHALQDQVEFSKEFQTWSRLRQALWNFWHRQPD